MSETLSKSTFDPYLKKHFTVSLGDASTMLELYEIAVPERSPAQFESFTLLFKGDEKNFMEQGIYRFESEGFQPTEMFLVPVAGDQTGYDYEVIVNRKIEASS